MKRLVIAIVLLVIIVAFCGISLSFFNNELSSMVSTLEKSREFVQNNDSASANNEFKSFRNDWNSSRTFIAFFTNHRLIQEIEVATEELDVVLYNNDLDKYLVSSSQQICRLEYLLEMQQPTFYNIF